MAHQYREGLACGSGGLYGPRIFGSVEAGAFIALEYSVQWKLGPLWPPKKSFDKTLGALAPAKCSTRKTNARFLSHQSQMDGGSCSKWRRVPAYLLMSCGTIRRRIVWLFTNLS